MGRQGGRVTWCWGGQVGWAGRVTGQVSRVGWAGRVTG